MHQVTEHTQQARLMAAVALMGAATAVFLLNTFSGAGSGFLISIGLAPNTLALAAVYLVGAVAGLYFLANHHEYAWRYQPLCLMLVCGLLFVLGLNTLLGALFL